MPHTTAAAQPLTVRLSAVPALLNNDLSPSPV